MHAERRVLRCLYCYLMRVNTVLFLEQVSGINQEHTGIYSELQTWCLNPKNLMLFNLIIVLNYMPILIVSYLPDANKLKLDFVIDFGKLEMLSINKNRY